MPPQMGGGPGMPPQMGGGPGMLPQMGSGPGMFQQGGAAPLPGMASGPGGLGGMAPGLADPMGNTNDPILGGEAAFPGPGGEYMVGQGPGQMVEYDENDEHEQSQGSLDLTTLGTGGEGDEDGESSFVDDILQGGRDPVIVGVLFALLSSPQFNAIFNQMVPRVGESILYNLGTKAVLIAVLYFAVKYFLLD